MRGRRATLKSIPGGLSGVPAAPAGLPVGMVEEWNTVAADLHRRGHLTAAMLGALETYVTALWTVRESRAALMRDGLLVDTADGKPKPHPAAGILSKAQETVARLSADFGLTPAAASKQSLQPTGGPTDDAWNNMDL